MSFMGGGAGVGAGPGSGLRFSQTRGRVQGSPVQGVNYPSPFFDVAHTYLPVTVKALFKWCRYYFLTNPLINATVFKLSEYPVTDIIIDHPDKAVVKKWTDYYQDHLGYRGFQVETGLDYHCFHGDVKAVTKDGVFRLRDLVGQTLQVLSQDGVYRPATFIESVSKQELLEVEFTDGSTVLATPEHQWPVTTRSGGITKVPTTELAGRHVPRNVAPRPEQNDDFYEGVRHGFVFGDGTLYNDGKQARGCFFGAKDQAMVRYFEGHGSPPYKESRGHTFIHGLPPHYKTLPENAASASYWYGFLSGFLAADGSVDVAGCVVLTQRSKATLEAIAEQLPRLGMIAGSVRGYYESTAYGEGTTYVLSLFKQYMLPQDFLIPHHAKNFEDNYKETAYGKRTMVRAVRQTGLVEKVYCCLEEETHTFTIDNGILTGNTYGNCAVSVGFPFKKYLYCRSCSWRDEASKCRASWIFTSYQFRLTCPKCGMIGDADSKDLYYKNPSGIKLIRWNPEDLEITYNDITGETTYFYTIPASVRNDVVIGRKDVVEGTPQIFIQAMRESKGVVFSKDNFFHLKRPTLANQDRGWGIPLLLPVLKDTFYLQLMKKAQEAILLEHIVPLRILFPQAGSGSSDPYCVSPDTLVETLTGLMPASEVHEGDMLRSHTGAWRRVEYQKRRAIKGGEKVFKFKVASLSAFPFAVSEEHPILAVPRVGGRKKPRTGLVDPTFIEAQTLRKGDYVAYPIKRQVRAGQMLDLGDYLQERAVTENWVYRRLSQGAAEVYEWLEINKDPLHAWGERKALLEEKGWSEADYETAYAMRREHKIDRVSRFMPMCPALGSLIGYYLSEGSYANGSVSFSLNIDEKNISENIEAIVKGLGFRGVSHYERPEQHGRSVVIEDVLLSEVLVSLCGEGFASKRIPDVVSEGSDAIVRDTLNALFQGDGCNFKTTTTDRVGLKLANPSVIMEARRLLLSFGLIGGVIKEEPTESTKFRTTSYQLNYNGHAAEKLRHLFGWAGGVDWKDLPQKSGIVRGDYVLLRVDDVKEVDDVPEVIGFQMSEDKSFCVAGVATHNTTINLVDWRDQIAAEIARWRWDNNYIPILPLPVGNQTIGGDGRALMLTGEIQAWSEQLMVGMGVPKEFLLGGMSYAGTNVSMRMLENAFIGYLIRQKRLARFVMKQVAGFMGWPEANIRFKPFKMADDLQRKAFMMQLNQAQKVSDTTLLADSDLSQADENEIMLGEMDVRMDATKKQQLGMAEIQGEASVIMAKYQAKAQAVMMAAQGGAVAPGEPGSENGSMTPDAAAIAAQQQQNPQAPAGGAVDPSMVPGMPMNGNEPPSQFLAMMGSQLSGNQKNKMQVDLPSLAMAQARSIAEMTPDMQQVALSNLAAQSPDLAKLVQQMLATLQSSEGAQGKSKGKSGVDTRPLPEQRSPRRAGAV